MDNKENLALVESALRKIKSGAWELLTEEEKSSNFSLHPKYLESREKVKSFIEDRGEVKVIPVPDECSATFKEYRIVLYRVDFPQGWSYSKAEIYRWDDLVATLYRNYSWLGHDWFEKGGASYLLFGEDYQGYGVLNLESGEKFVYRSPVGGFCWSTFKVSPSARWVAVSGCFWGGPGENILYEIPEDPRQMPWKKVTLTEHSVNSFGDMGHYIHKFEWGGDPGDSEDEELFMTLCFDISDLSKELDDKMEEEVRQEMSENAKNRS